MERSLAPRTPLESSVIGPPEQYDSVADSQTGGEGGFPYRLVVKFSDEARVRVRDDISTSDADDKACLADISQVASSLKLKLTPSFDEIDPELDDLLLRAEEASGTAQPDMHGVVEVELLVDDGKHLVEAAKQFDDLACVEYVSVEEVAPPPPLAVGSDDEHGDSSGNPPDLKSQQGYLGSGQFEVNWMQAQGANGSRIRYTDCEYSFNERHVEYSGKVTQYFRVDPNRYEDHGTASVGITMGNPRLGIRGMAPGASAYFSSEYPLGSGYNRKQSVQRAISGSRAGDVVLLEMQTGAGAPAETDSSIWSLVKAGSDAGVVIVAAAGNGNQNLDSSTYSSYRRRGDSGAIIVGAGNDRFARQSFSTFGRRVDVQAWGGSVFTAGYGDYRGFSGANQKNQHYTSSFSGTSSASALTAGAVTLFQSWARRQFGSPFTPSRLRSLLKSTGRRQTGSTSQNIGPHTNLRAAAGQAR